MKRRTKVLIGVAAVLLLVTPIVAQRPSWGGPAFHPFRHNSEGMIEHIATVLDLTESQKASAKTLFEAAKSQAQPIVGQLKQGHDEMTSAVKANNPAAIKNLATNQGALVGQLAGIHAATMAQFYAQLTPEQKAKADKMHDQIRSHFMSRF